MPRYFFDIEDGYLVTLDHKGQQLPNDDAARSIALNTLPNMAGENVTQSDHRTLGVSVRNAERQVIYAATLVLIGGWKKKRT